MPPVWIASTGGGSPAAAAWAARVHRQIHTPGHRRRERGDRVLDTLKTVAAYAPLASFIPGLEAARAEIVAEQQHHKALVTAESVAEAELEIAKTKCREAYRDAYPALQLEFPGRKRLVDSFFYQPRKRKAKRTVVEVSVDEGDDGDRHLP